MPETLKFVYTIVHEILGISVPESGEAILIDDPDSGAWACITRDPSEYRKDIDESAAVATMLLRSLVGGGPEGTFEERLDFEIASIAKERSIDEKRSYLVLQVEGEVTDWETPFERETDRLIVRLNGAPKTGAQNQAKMALASLVIAISQLTGRNVRLSKHAEGLVLFRTDGKKIYAKEASASGSASVSASWKPEHQPSLQKDFESLQRLTSLSRVHHLFAASVEQPDDRLRAFLSGWAALEILVNKVFGDYESDFLGGLTTDADPDAKEWYVERIRDVMKDKYRLRDRFSLIAASLDAEGADADVEDFVAAKKSRDALAHGQEVPDNTLPIEGVHRILGKYLRLHATRER